MGKRPPGARPVGVRLRIEKLPMKNPDTTGESLRSFPAAPGG